MATRQAAQASEEIELDEAATRKIIDRQLRDAGWEVDSETLTYEKGMRPMRARNLAIAEWPTLTKGKEGWADYVLFAGLTVIAVVEAMGLQIWIPAPDRAAVLKEAPGIASNLRNELPLNYDSTTLKTIEYIDVLWLKGRSMARAFEVEHTTAIYSGILRMADLLALQPNMDIRLHIVAPEARKEKVFDEIRRPVFSLLEGKPLSARCTFLSYDAIRDLADVKHLEHLSDSVLEEYEEGAL